VESSFHTSRALTTLLSWKAHSF